MPVRVKKTRQNKNLELLVADARDVAESNDARTEGHPEFLATSDSAF
jgi:hypothetical protein